VHVYGMIYLESDVGRDQVVWRRNFIYSWNNCMGFRQCFSTSCMECVRLVVMLPAAKVHPVTKS
jgi:hypothetical protein